MEKLREWLITDKSGQENRGFPYHGAEYKDRLLDNAEIVFGIEIAIAVLHRRRPFWDQMHKALRAAIKLQATRCKNIAQSGATTSHPLAECQEQKTQNNCFMHGHLGTEAHICLVSSLAFILFVHIYRNLHNISHNDIKEEGTVLGGNVVAKALSSAAAFIRSADV